jgi:hypothetical protein
MAVDVLAEIVIDRPCDHVASDTADPSHAPDWYWQHRLIPMAH